MVRLQEYPSSLTESLYRFHRGHWVIDRLGEHEVVCGHGIVEFFLNRVADHRRDLIHEVLHRLLVHRHDQSVPVDVVV